MRAWVAAQGWSPERAAVYVADARDMAAMAAAGRACIAAQGLPDVVIANAGVSVGVDMSVEADLEVLRSVIETNNLGMAATFQPFIAPMCERRGGRLVGIASVAGIRGLPGHAAYSLSKAGVISFCESLRVECRPFGVRVVTIAPGYIDTPLTRGNSYSMPFLMPADKFARQALDAIAAGVGLRVIPWQMGVLARILRILPNWIYDRAVAGRGRKARKSQ
jgi:NAD(P)-dependent dehydrogenase (short-subunit alcohol dehydrogenase family)